ncbi:DUF4389 domain-containing protein [bacterium]|nr:DUF4389 domain-containing protein [bacterium]
MEKYPATLTIDYAEKSNRLTVFFRLFMAIPILIILALLAGCGFKDQETVSESNRFIFFGIVFLPTLLMLVFRRKYPRWWFDWNLALMKFAYRVSAYLLLLRDEYPSTDEEQSVHLDIPYPDAENELNQWLPLVKWFLAIPHLFVLTFLLIAVIFVSIWAWSTIMFTSRYPKNLFDFVVGTLRWGFRVEAYAFLLTTDEYPPFSLSE